MLAICAADAADEPPQAGLIKLTVNEVRRLINTFIIRPIHELAHRLRWSQWRRPIKPEPDEPTTNNASTPNFNHDPERRLP